MSFQASSFAGSDIRRQILSQYDQQTRENVDLYKIIRLVPDFPWNSLVAEYFGEFGRNGIVILYLGTHGVRSCLRIRTNFATIGVKQYVCAFLRELGFGAEIENTITLKITSPLVYGPVPDIKRQILEMYDLRVRANTNLYKVIRLVPDFPWNSLVAEHFAEVGGNITANLIQGNMGNYSHLLIRSDNATTGVKDYVCSSKSCQSKFG
jgi:hypothetical protein